MVLKVEDLEIYQMAEELADKVWNICIKWDYFAKDTIGKQLVRAADSISVNLAEGHGRYHFKDRLNFCYYARGSLEETKSWLSKAVRRRLISHEINRIKQIIELLPKKLNAYIVPGRKLLFFPISTSGSNYNPRNTQCIPVVIIFAFLDLEKNP